MTIRTAPFARARMMMAAIAAIVTQFAGNVSARIKALETIGPYESHGKGHGGPGTNKHSTRCVAYDKRDARKARNRKNHKRHL